MKRLLTAALLLCSLPAAADMDIRIALNWLPPSENVDGTPLTDLAGFRAYWGYSSGDYEASITIDDHTATSATITPVGVPSGSTIWIVLTAFDLDGNESQFSNEIFFGPYFEIDANPVNVPNPPTEIGATARIVRCGGASCQVGNPEA